MRRNLSLAALAVSCLAFAPTARAQGLLTSSFMEGSPECEDRFPDVAASPGGSFVMVWSRQCGLSPGPHLIARPYSAEGRPLGPEVDLGLGYAPSLAALPDGGYALASVGVGAQGSELRLARLDGRGRRVGAAEIADPGAPAFSRDNAPRLAVDRAGNLALIWVRYLLAQPNAYLLRRFAADLSPQGEAVTFADRTPAYGTSPDLAFADDGDLLVAWSNRVFDEFPNYTAIFGRRYRADGTAARPSFRITGPGAGLEHHAPRLLGAQHLGGWLMTWPTSFVNFPTDQSRFEARFTRLAKGTVHRGRAYGSQVREQGVFPFDPAIGTDPAGNVLVLAAQAHGSLAARLFDPTGTATGEPLEVAPPGVYPHLDGPTFSRSVSGSFLAVWGKAERVFQDQEFQIPTDWDLHGRIFRKDCPVGRRAACLLSDRFGIEVLRLEGATERARPIRLDDRSALFAFPGREQEVSVSLTEDGSQAALTYAATTNRALTIRITDRITGQIKTMTKPAGRFASGRIAGLAANLRPLGAPAVPAISEIPAAPPLGLFGDRFKIEVSRPAEGGDQPARGALFDDRRAAFRFGDDLDLTVALIDGGASNGKFWVYLGDLSDGAYRVKITDSATGKVKTYTKPAGRLLTQVDRQAF